LTALETLHIENKKASMRRLFRTASDPSTRLS
jgi:hypothetical protein